MDIIKEGVYHGEIRDDISPEHIRQVVLGTIEHQCMPRMIFCREFSADDLIDAACQVIFSGIAVEKRRQQ